MFIFATKKKIFIVEGNNITEKNYDIYKKASLDYIKDIKKYEKLGEDSDNINFIKQKEFEEKYEELIARKTTFVVFVDQGGCTTADKLRGFVQEWAKVSGVKVYRIMFSDMKETSLHEVVKFYPSVALVAKGRPVAWLRADEDEDADAYNNYDDFAKWIGKYLQ